MDFPPSALGCPKAYLSHLAFCYAETQLSDYTALEYKELDDCRDYPNLVVRTMCYIAETGCFVKLSCAHNLLLAELATH